MPRIVNGSQCALLALSMVFGAAHAFERTEMRFAPPGANAAADAVKISFVGKTLDPALDILKSDDVPDKEVRPFQQFLRNFHRYNLEGSKESILRLWAPAERSRIAAEMDVKSLGENKTRFQEMTGLKLRGIIEYGGYHIVFVRTEYGTNAFPLKLALKSVDGNLQLTNELNGDYFYDNISHFLDRPDTKQVAR